MFKKYKLTGIFLAVTTAVSGCLTEKEHTSPHNNELNSEAFIDVSTFTQKDSFEEVMLDWKDTFEDEISFYQAARKYFNCYAYATGSVGNPFSKLPNGKDFIAFASPGTLGGRGMQIMTAEELHESVLSDGLEHATGDFTSPNSPEPLHKDGYKLVAAFIDSSMDNSGIGFHFAVRDENGKWTHKNGASDVYLYQSEFTKEPLPSPHIEPSAYLGDKYSFVAYYWRPNEGINVTASTKYPPVGAFSENIDGTLTYKNSGTYNTETVSQQVWVGARGDYLQYNAPIKNLSLNMKNDEIRLDVNGTDIIIVPQGIIYDHFDISNATYFEIMDNTGEIFSVTTRKDGDTTIKSYRESIPEDTILPPPFPSL